MLKDKKIIIGLCVILLFFPFFSPKANSATTIGDTTFPADVGKTYTWKLTYPPVASGAKFTFEIESIEQGVYLSIDALIVYATFRGYMPGYGWQTMYDNERYMVANNTLNYVFFDEFLYAVVIPTPIDLALVAEAIYLDNYSIVDNTIIENYYGDIEEYNYNTNGFLTSCAFYFEGELETKFVLSSGGGGGIPFGNFFLIFMVIGVIALVCLKKHKIR